MRNLLIAVSLFIFVFGCSPAANNGPSKGKSIQALVPVPADPTTIDSQLKRFRGQTEFLTVSYHSRYLAGQPSKDKAGGAESTAERAMQESDIFKIGKPGTKLLFLLNNYRGLQIVDFSAGANQPKLLGRVAATGNWPDDMYYDASNDRIYVLEHIWNSPTQESKSRLLVYDVSKPATPAIVQTLEFEGLVVDSRMVGHVLYTVGTFYPRNYNWGNQTAQPKGYVHSFDLARKTVTEVAQYTLALPSAYGELMNVVKTEVAGETRYYLVAVLNETGWGWWSRKSMVEVVDISDPDGKISPLMVVSAKGTLRERSQTAIKDGTLLVTSNFTTTGGAQSWRIAVETFGLPKTTSEVLSDSEAKFRQMYIDREMTKYSGNEPEAQREKLLADKELGLKGRFVRSTEGALRKVVADSLVTVGDTTGLSAVLQDTRVSDGLLYAFWVPQNQVDPLDLFDVSDATQGAKYLCRLMFDGWIQRAIPMKVQGRQFVLGLGWILPAVDNDNGRRYPQAALFEIKSVNGVPKAEQVAQLTLNDPNVWTDFNAADKFMEVRNTGEGRGEILFSAYSWSATGSTQGGKVIGFDINAAVGGSSGALVEGAFLVGESGWLRRVFTNTEIDRVNTFSDQQLGVFDVQNLIASKGPVPAVATLELARNLRAYSTLLVGAVEKGVQVVSDYSYWGTTTGSTELRVVTSARADAEKPETEILNLKGGFDSLLKLPSGELLVLTRQTVVGDAGVTDASKNDVGRPGWVPENSVDTYRLFRVNEKSLGTNGVMQTVEWNVKRQWDGGFSSLRPYYGFTQADLLLTPEGAVLIQDSESIRVVGLQAGLSLTDVKLESCVPGRKGLGLKFLGGRSFLFSSENGVDPVRQGISYARNFLADAVLSGATLVCGEDRNIPGTPLTLKGDVLVTQDTWANEVRETRTEYEGKINVYYNLVARSGLTAVKFGQKLASLTDQRETNSARNDSTVVLRTGSLVTLSQEQESWNPWNYSDPTEQDYDFAYVTTDLSGSFTSQEYSLELKIGRYGRVQFVTEAGGPEGGLLPRYLVVVSGSQGMQILGMVGDARPQTVEFSTVDSAFNLSKPVDRLPSAFYFGEDAVHFTASLKSFEFARGLAGVDQIFLK